MGKYSVLEPYRLYDLEYRTKFEENSDKYFEEMVKESAVDVEANRKTVREIDVLKDDLKKLRKKLSGKKALKTFLIICCVITAIFAVLFFIDALHGFGADMDAVFSLPGFVSLILLVVCIGLNVLFALLISKKLNSVIKELKAEIYENDKVLSEKIQVARAQLSPLYALFDWNMPAEIIERTTPLIDFDKFFDIRKLCYIRKKYGFTDNADTTESSWLIHSGSIVGNPFLFLRTFSREMYDETYHGYLTIHWETYSTDSDGNTVVNHHSQTLHATVTAPAPRYEYYTKLVYVNDAAPDLSFSREPSGADKMSEKQLEREIKRGTKEIQKKEVESGLNFTGMTNNEFDVLFGALDRDNEKQFRLLFTPLAQKNILELIKSDKYYGDDFYYTKKRGINIIASKHAQQTDLFASPYRFNTYSFDALRKEFNDYNCEFFKSVYFDLAPLLSIPLFQQYKPTEYIYDKDFLSNYTSYEHESLANSFNSGIFAHERTKTRVILKSSMTTPVGNSDVVKVSAYSFDAVPRVTYVTMRGGDGYLHDVPVEWTEYIPLEKDNYMQVKKLGLSEHDFRTLMSDSEFAKIISAKSGGRYVFERGLLAMALNSSFSAGDDKGMEDTLNEFLERIKANTQSGLRPTSRPSEKSDTSGETATATEEKEEAEQPAVERAEEETEKVDDVDENEAAEKTSE